MLRRIIDLASFGFMMWVIKVCALDNLTPKITSENMTAVVICAAIVLTCISLIIVFRRVE
jgi:hypothetical protein